jgi:hypothetical protein
VQDVAGVSPDPAQADVAAQRGRHLAADRADDGLGDERRLGLLRLEPAVRARAAHEDRDRQDRDEVDPQVLQVGEVPVHLRAAQKRIWACNT